MNEFPDRIHQTLIRTVVEGLADTPMVLKGGPTTRVRCASWPWRTSMLTALKRGINAPTCLILTKLMEQWASYLAAENANVRATR